jgi:hypothetical protein
MRNWLYADWLMNQIYDFRHLNRSLLRIILRRVIRGMGALAPDRQLVGTSWIRGSSAELHPRGGTTTSVYDGFHMRLDSFCIKGRQSLRQRTEKPFALLLKFMPLSPPDRRKTPDFCYF